MNVLCACGCGLPAPISKRTNRAKGLVKGVPARFISGHSLRVFRGNRPRLAEIRGYRQRPISPGRTTLVHRQLAEQAFGKPLPPQAEVHHVDGDIGSLRPRLVICPDRAYHMLLHVRERILRAGGNPNTDRICYVCHAVKPIASFTPAAVASGRGKCRQCPVARAKEAARKAAMRAA